MKWIFVNIGFVSLLMFNHNALASVPSNAVTPALTVPGAPTAVSGVSGNTNVTVSFKAPTNDGGATLTGYTVTSSPAGLTGVGTSSPIVVTGLSNGTAYTFMVTAANSVGSGFASAPSAPVIPATVPYVPTIGTAVAKYKSASVSFTAPAYDGDAAITTYTVCVTDTIRCSTGSGSPIIVPGLSNGTSYTFTVYATNSMGHSAVSGSSNAVTPGLTVPETPLIGIVTPNDRSVSVAFTPSAYNGGSSITYYTVTTSPGGAITSGRGSPIKVTGLTNGQSYAFKVTATNGVGTSVASASSAAVTPATTPGAPVIGTALAGYRSASISFTAPVDTGGSPISSYTICANGTTSCSSGSGSPITVTGLADRTPYTFSVYATNGMGDSIVSAPSNAVSPGEATPGAPVRVTAVAGPGQATVGWDAPANDGGSTITGYTVTAHPGSATCSPYSLSLLTCAVTGLKNGEAYTFTVTATNSLGTSTAGDASKPVTPATVPNAPTIVSASGGNGLALVTWAAPSYDGGSTITSYTARANPGDFTCTGGAHASSCQVTGLTNGSHYTFTVYATNSAGNSALSGVSNAVTAATTVPDAPMIGPAKAAYQSAAVSFTAPANDGGTTVTQYTAISSPGGFTGTGITSPITVTGLTEGSRYTFTVTATNSTGTGAASAASNVIMPITTAPGAPIVGMAQAGDASATVAFTPPTYAGGSTIVYYTVTSNPATIPQSGIGSPISMHGLTNGVAYTFTVTATNSLGTSVASTSSNSVTPVSGLIEASVADNAVQESLQDSDLMEDASAIHGPLLIAAGQDLTGSQPPLLIQSTDGGKSFAIPSMTMVDLAPYGVLHESVCNGQHCLSVGKDYLSGAPLLVQSTNGGANWTIPSLTLSKLTAKGHLNAASCSGNDAATICLAAGKDDKSGAPLLLQSTDGGMSWTIPSLSFVDLPAKGVFHAVSCTGSGATAICIAAGVDEATDSPLLVESTNGGASWALSSTLLADKILHGVFRTASCSGTGETSVCIAAGVNEATDPYSESLFVQSTDGGKSWSQRSLADLTLKAEFNAASCTGNGSSAWCSVAGVDAYSGAPLLVQSRDGGHTWFSPSASLVGLTTNGVFHASSCVGGGHSAMCIAVGQDTTGSEPPLMAQSRDGGASWMTTTIPQLTLHGVFNAVTCTESEAATVCTAVGLDEESGAPLFVLSTNGGESWTIPSMTMNGLTSQGVLGDKPQ